MKDIRIVHSSDLHVDDDRIAHPPFVHDIPVPFPPPGYVLPPGTYLTPLLARIYAIRSGERNPTL